MKSGIGYRLGMSVIVVGSLLAAGLILFPSVTQQLLDKLRDLTSEVAVGDQPADLLIESDELVVDGRVRWSILVANGGPGNEDGPIVVRGTLPSQAEFVSSSGQDWNCQYAEASGVLTCDLDGPLANGEQTELVVLANSGGFSDLRYTATVIGSGMDPELANNVDDDVWTAALSSVVEDSEGASGDAAERADQNRASGDTPLDGGETATESLPVTGPAFTAWLLAAGLALCLFGIRLRSTATLPSLLKEFRQGPLWPGPEMGDHLG